MPIRYFFIFCIFIFCFSTANAQHVTIEGKKFKIGSENFYPLVMNFRMEPAYDDYTNTYFVASNHNYGVGPWDEFTATNCATEIQTNYNYIADMGFNALRVTEISPYYDETTGGLFFTFQEVNSNTNSYVGTSTIQIYPTVSSDPGMAKVLAVYDKILDLANNTIKTSTSSSSPLKVILLLGQGGQPGAHTISAAQISAWNDFYAAVATHFAANTNSYMDALFAIDFENEPGEFISSPNTKKEICDIVSGWNTSVKSNDDQILTTIGLNTSTEVFAWDPAALHIDFASFHDYPDYHNIFNDIYTLSSTQNAMKQRIANEFYYFNQICTIPWIIGETGFSATASTITTDAIGTLSDMGNYASYTLDAVCNCGGQGYSWWEFQDAASGVLQSGMNPSSSSEKQPIVDNFRNYIHRTTGPCPTDYSPTYDATKMYYNPYGFSTTNPANKFVSSTVTDQNGLPVRNALIELSVFDGYINPKDPKTATLT